MNILLAAAAVATSLLVSQYLGNAGFALFPALALLLLAHAIRSRRRAGDTDAQAHARRRPPAWLWAGVGVGAGLGALVWALGVWVLWAAGALAFAVIFVRFRPGRSATPSPPSVSPVSSPVDSGSWLDELPGRVADAVDAARLIRGHADAAGAQAPDVGEET